MYSFEKREIVKLKTDFLKMGEINPSGDKIYSTNLFFTKNDKPYTPIMGEAHISRLPRKEWEDRILKIKANGVNIISSYIFWINHEFYEGQFDFTGDNDIGEFIRLCKKHNMLFSLRIGPWVNAEYRNGGFPDWLYKSNVILRDNNEQYLFYVKRYYNAVYEQVKPFLYKNGGNIVMIQFENELTNNPEHILKLKEIALQIGLTAPIYTATGWNLIGGALLPKKDVIPMFGGYAAKPWTSSIDKIKISSHFNFSHLRNSAEIGNDLIKPGSFTVNINLDDYPYSFCELGTGICVGRHRRPYVSSIDDYSMVLTKLGSGCNLLGYYLICGGINKIINGTTLCRNNEIDKNALVYPIFNNFFQAPISEHGDYKNSYRLLKLINLFINDFGSELAEMQPYLQKNLPNDDDDSSLRYAMRKKNDSGYIFVNHHCHLLKLKSIFNIQFEISNETKAIPENPINVTEDTAFFFPFNVQYGKIKADYITAQPICKIGNTFFFKEISGIEPIYKFQDCPAIKAKVGKDNGFSKQNVKFITLTEEESLYIYKFNNKVFIGNKSDLVYDMGIIKNVGFAKAEYYEYNGDSFICKNVGKDIELCKVTYKKINNAELDNTYQYELFENFHFVQKKTWQEIVPYMADRKISYYEITVSNSFGYIHIAYSGDTAQLYVNGKMCDDNFYNGMEWVIPAEYFYRKKCILVISEYTHDIYVDVEPETNLSLDNIYVSSK